MDLPPPSTIETDRLSLRLPKLSDVSDIFEYASDPEVTLLMDWRRVSDAAQVHQFLALTASGWTDRTEYTWVITERGVDRVIGAFALRVRQSDADFGYVLNREAWGRGIALEASRAVIDAHLSTHPGSRIWATCDIENR